MTREETIEQLNLTIGLIKQDSKDWLDDRDIPMLEECAKALSQEPSDTVSRGVFDQVRWERDIAIEQLHELGYELGQKIEPCDDAVSRILKRMWNCRGKHTTSIDKVKMEQIIREELLPVTQKPIECDDAISRQAVLECFKKWQPYMATRLFDFEKELTDLPSVIPTCEEREKGECPYYAG